MTTARNILQRLNAVMKEVDYIQREQKQGMRYKIVSHDKVTALVRPALVNHGVAYWPSAFRMEQNGNRTQLHCKVIFANIDDRSDFIEVDTAGYGIDDQDKGPGKAISYAVKYALLKALGLETGDDPDLDQETPHKPEPIATKKPPPTYDRNPLVQKEFTRLQNGIRQIEQVGNVEDLALFWKNNAESIKAMPADWKSELEGMKDEAKAALAQRVAA